jgi:hypothetical protein
MNIGLDSQHTHKTQPIQPIQPIQRHLGFLKYPSLLMQ